MRLLLVEDDVRLQDSLADSLREGDLAGADLLVLVEAEKALLRRWRATRRGGECAPPV